MGEAKPVVVINDTQLPAFIIFSTRKIIRAFEPHNMYGQRRSSALFASDEGSSLYSMVSNDRPQPAISRADRESISFCEREIAQVEKLRIEVGDSQEVNCDISTSSVFYVQVQFLKDDKYTMGWMCKAWSGQYVRLKLSRALPAEYKRANFEMLPLD